MHPVSQVNKFRNAMTGRKDWFESNGNACSITRENGGAVIVMKGSGNVSVTNGGGYCPAGTYTDRVSGKNCHSHQRQCRFERYCRDLQRRRESSDTSDTPDASRSRRRHNLL